MNEFRIRESGAVVSEQEFRAMHNASFPQVIDIATLNEYGADPVLQSPAPVTTVHQSASRTGVVQDALGNWVHGWVVTDWTQEQIDAAYAATVPQAVTMRQARLALLGAGMLSTVNTAIAGMAGAQGDAARIEWEFSSEVKRNQPLIATLAPALGLTAVQLDGLFITAATL